MPRTAGESFSRTALPRRVRPRPRRVARWRGLVDPLADRLRDLLGLAEPEADVAVLVAHHHQRAEAEAPAALHDLRHAVDVDDLLLQLDAVGVGDDAARSAGGTFRHGSFLELESALARPLGDGAHAAVVEEAVAVEHDL